MLTYSRPDPSVNPSANGKLLNGRGFAHRKLDRHDREELAADVLSGLRPFQPSLAQICQLFGASPVGVREVLKARTKAKTNGNGDAKVETDEDVLAYIERVGVGRAWRAIERLID